MVNGSPTEEFECQKGLRQGDPLSPFLFVIAMEVWSCLIKKAVLERVIDGLQLPNGGPILSHFLFADDVVFLGIPNRRNVDNLNRLLRGFCVISGLQINH